MAVDCGEGVIVGGELELGVEGGMDWFCSSRADGGLPNGLVTTIGGTEIGSSLASPYISSLVLVNTTSFGTPFNRSLPLI